MTDASQTAAVTLVSMDQPTTRRDHKSITAAKYSHPCPVWNWVTSAAHNRSGPFGLKLRPTRSGAGAVSDGRAANGDEHAPPPAGGNASSERPVCGHSVARAR